MKLAEIEQSGLPERQRRLCLWKSEIFCFSRDLALPLLLIFALLIFPRLLLIWIPMVLLWGACEAIYRRSSPRFQVRLKGLLPDRIKECRWVHDLADGMRQVRPFIFISLYFACIPVALFWMFAHWLMRLTRKAEEKQPTVLTQELVSFIQNRRCPEEEEETNFYHSPAFSITCVTLFASGLPAALTYLLYNKLGIDAILGFPSADPRFNTIFGIIHLYIYSIGWCVSVLFLRSWFTFPLNFGGEEERIELDARGVKRFTNSWFTQVFTGNMPWAGPSSLTWSDIKALRLDKSNAPLYPLPQIIFPANSICYSILNKLAMFYDGLLKNVRRNEFVYFSTSQTASAISGQLRLKLSDIDSDQRAQIYYAVKTWAPHVVIDDAAQERFIGSSTLQAPNYTQLWFELLADRMPKKRLGMLTPGTTLKSGSLTIERRISSGGQANIYLAVKDDGNEVVLKEFILSTSDAVGALVESAGDFETEASLLSELKHSRIVNMLGFFAEDRRLYIVLEKIDGVSLRQLVKNNGALEERQAVELALQVLEVLEYLHGREPSVVHRDITPDNLMYSEAQGVKVIDFSLAAGKKVRRTSRTIGKHCYVPPEQLREQPCPQSDIYALGATMYFLLTGVDPKPITMCDIKDKRPEIAERLNEIIKRATALNLEDRYSEAKWLKLDLQACFSDDKPLAVNEQIALSVIPLT